MEIVEWIGLGVFALLLLLCAIFLRREVISRRGGTIEVSLRLSEAVAGRGWSPGIARFVGDEMRWYRVFSLAPRPRRKLSRLRLSVQERRAPGPQERLVLPDDWVIVRCSTGREPVEIAMARTTLTGFLSWLEAGSPGQGKLRFAA
jgi:Protein of unknown function (DUF2550)